jgi:hypothetical protein
MSGDLDLVTYVQNVQDARRLFESLKTLRKEIKNFEERGVSHLQKNQSIPANTNPVRVTVGHNKFAHVKVVNHTRRLPLTKEILTQELCNHLGKLGGTPESVMLLASDIGHKIWVGRQVTQNFKFSLKMSN